MSKKDRRRKKKQRKGRGQSSGGGRLSGMRSGMKSFVGTGGRSNKKESPLSRAITYLLLAALVGLLIYRFTR